MARFDALLRRAGGGGAAAAPAGHPGVQRVQSQLAAHGFDPGVSHGFLDANTRTSLRKFQASNGLPQTGVIDSATNTALQEPSSDGGTPGYEEGESIGQAPAIAHTTRMIGTPIIRQAGTTPAGVGNMASKRGRQVNYKSTGFRVPMVFTAVIAAAGNAALSLNPQMDFRGENIVIDQTVVGPQCTVTMPTVGTIPQIAASTTNNSAVPGTMFPPTQTHATNFKMDIANQGNALSFTATNTNTTLALNFAALIFGHEVEEDTSTTAGVARAGSFNG